LPPSPSSSSSSTAEADPGGGGVGGAGGGGGAGSSDSTEAYTGLRSWLGKTLTDALSTVRNATTLQLLLHVLAHKVLEDSLISPGIAQIAISLMAAQITAKVRTRC
jgi:hypothetical protein